MAAQGPVVTRREALNLVALLAAQGMVTHGQGLTPGFLTVDLDQWKGIIVRLKGKEPLYLDVADLFEAFREV